MSRNAAILLALAALWASACDPPPPSRVWVPGPDFVATLDVSIGDGSVAVWRVGEWITLHADRSTGPWVQVARKDLPEGAPWMRQPPPAREYNVEANVRWLVEPEGFSRFNLPGAQDILTRKVQFNTPGNYRLWAESHSWGGGQMKSNVIEIVITE